MADLKPCPFCGEPARESGGFPWHLIICTVCKGRMMGETRAKVAEAWNQRSDSARIQEVPEK